MSQISSIVKSPIKATSFSKSKEGSKACGSSGCWDVSPQFSDLVIPRTATSEIKPGLYNNLPAASAKKSRFEEAEAEHHEPAKTWGETAKKIGIAAGLGTLAIAGLAVNAAQAQTAPEAVFTTMAIETNQVRSQAPVRVESPADAVEKFSAENQLYVIGNPQLNGEPVNLESFERVLADHPNIYVVINGDYVSDLSATESLVGRGIGNHEEFLNVKNEELGEREGVVFYINLNVNKEDSDTGRATLMRSEGLPDQLGVGDGIGGTTRDAWFPNGRPGELGRVFIRKIKDERKDLGTSMGAVFDTINTEISDHVEYVTSSAQRQAEDARSQVRHGIGAARYFQQNFGEEGELGSPDIEHWQRLGRQLENALLTKNFEQVANLQRQISSEVGRYSQLVQQYRTAPERANNVRGTIASIESQIGEISDSETAERVRRLLTTADQELSKFDVSYEAHGATFNYELGSAERASENAKSMVRSAIQKQERNRELRNMGIAAVSVGLLGAAVIKNYGARKAGRKAEEELSKALAEVEQKTQSLVETLDINEYSEVGAYTGQTKVLVDGIIHHTTAALTLMGGAKKFVAEAESLIEGRSLGRKIANLFSRGNFNAATKLLNTEDEGGKLKFGINEATRVEFQKSSKALGWRDEILQAGSTRQFETSFRSVLEKLQESEDEANSLNKVVLEASDGLTQYLGFSNQLDGDARALQQDGLDTPFALPSLSSDLLPQLPMVKDGVLSAPNGTKAEITDPATAFTSIIQPYEKKNALARKLVDVGTTAKHILLPTLARTDETLAPHGVKTEWAHVATNKLSEQLNSVAANAFVDPNSDEKLNQILDKVYTLNATLETTMAQNQERTDELPPAIAKTESRIGQSRHSLFLRLRAMGAFAHGTAEQVLREPGFDPSVKLASGKESLKNSKWLLDAGNTAQAGDELLSTRMSVKLSNEWITKSESALENYSATLKDRQSQIQTQTARARSESPKILNRLQVKYSPAALEQVAKSVGVEQSVVHSLQLAEQGLSLASKLTSSATESFQGAELINSATELESANQALAQVETQLSAIAKAEKILAAKDSEAVESHAELRNQMSIATGSLNQVYVRPVTRDKLPYVQSAISRSGDILNKTLKNPIEALKTLAVGEKFLKSLTDGVESDRKMYTEANEAVQTVTGLESKVQKEIDNADEWSKSKYVSGHGHVTTTVGTLQWQKKQLRQMKVDIKKATGLLNSLDYEESLAILDSVRATADKVSTEIDNLVSSAESEHKRELEVAKAAARRNRSYSSSSSSSYSSSSSSSGSIFGSSSSSSSSWGSSSSSWGSSSSSSSSGGFGFSWSSGGSSGGFSSSSSSGGSSGSW